MAVLARGFWHAHMSWIFDRDMCNQQRFAPDLLADEDVVRANKYFWVLDTEAALGEATRDGTVTSQVVNERVQVRKAHSLIGQGLRPAQSSAGMGAGSGESRCRWCGPGRH